MIRFKEVSKTYAGMDDPAVSDLSFEIPEGEVCVLVGPSGCGKTTTMRMINRLVEISSGEIFIDGEPLTSMNPTRLRRKIGYVIQGIGLFPHRTIEENIATVPQLLEWDKNRTRDRVTELLELVGMEPGQFRDRYPAELSGGQQQRVGVARAMAGDPPIMLMDEPFGAVDPITRSRLQDEFLNIQENIKKTIVFVTHDIDEAIRMGDRIAILARGGVLAQYATPGEILSDPASEFVASFVGTDRVLKNLSLVRLGDLELEPFYGEDDDLPYMDDSLSLKDALSKLIGSGADRGVVYTGDASNDNGARRTITLDGIRELSRSSSGG